MKSFLKAALAALVVTLAACGGNANAQVIPLTYKASDNKALISLTNAKSITVVSGKLRIENAATNYADVLDNGTVYAAIIVDPKFLAQYVQVGATAKWLNINQIATLECVSNKSRVLWQSKWQYASDDFQDNCAVFYAVLARTAN